MAVLPKSVRDGVQRVSASMFEPKYKGPIVHHELHTVGRTTVIGSEKNRSVTIWWHTVSRRERPCPLSGNTPNEIGQTTDICLIKSTGTKRRWV